MFLGSHYSHSHTPKDYLTEKSSWQAIKSKVEQYSGAKSCSFVPFTIVLCTNLMLAINLFSCILLISVAIVLVSASRQINIEKEIRTHPHSLSCNIFDLSIVLLYWFYFLLQFIVKCIITRVYSNL